MLTTKGGGVKFPGSKLLDDAHGAVKGGGLSFGKDPELVALVVTLEARYATEDCGCFPRGVSILSTWNDSSSPSLVKHLLDMETTKQNFLDIIAESSRGVTGSPRAYWTISRSGAIGDRPWRKILMRGAPTSSLPTLSKKTNSASPGSLTSASSSLAT